VYGPGGRTAVALGKDDRAIRAAYNPPVPDLRDLLRWTGDQIADYREGLADRPVAPSFDPDQLRARLGGSLPAKGADPAAVVEQLAAAVEPVLTATAGPRYFGFVVGGALDGATAADMLASGWDQVAFNFTTSPAAALVEEVVGAWLKEVLGLPAGASFGVVTGGQAANTVALAAARHRTFATAGWDVESLGLQGAPKVRIVAGEERHATIDRTLRLLGFGSRIVDEVPAGPNGAIDIGHLSEVLATDPGVPTILCLQAGNVNTGACDDLEAGCELARRNRGWVHVDGAFGLWAAASPTTSHLVKGIEWADSWAVDGHKWLNVPYDSGYVFCTDQAAHMASMAYTAAYLEGHVQGLRRAPSDYVPESSRRARGFSTWAALRQLGKQGLADLVDRCCAHARLFGELLRPIDGVKIGNEIVLNQVLVSFGDDDRTDRVIAAIQREGTFWAGGTTWRGRRYLRISVSNWSTTPADVERSVAAIRRLLSEA
jgi:glutamate/tyrosine decarboxylase-like PLP-dependent enzyme